MARIGALLVGLCLILSVPALAQSKKRSAPKPVAPVVLDGVRYEPQPWATVDGVRQSGGFVSAVDAASGRERWVAKIYDVARDDSIEDDKQDVFITLLRPAPGRRELIIENERGARFRLDVSTHRARRE